MVLRRRVRVATESPRREPEFWEKGEGRGEKRRLRYRADAGRATGWGVGVFSPLPSPFSLSYLAAMRAVGLKELKNRLSEYVKIAAGGETVLVTNRDRVVAELGPPREGRSPLLADAALADAVRRGWLAPPTMVTEGVPPRLPVAPLAEVLRELDADRAER